MRHQTYAIKAGEFDQLIQNNVKSDIAYFIYLPNPQLFFKIDDYQLTRNNEIEFVFELDANHNSWVYKKYKLDDDLIIMAI